MIDSRWKRPSPTYLPSQRGQRRADAQQPVDVIRQLRRGAAEHFAWTERLDLRHDDLEGMPCRIGRLIDWHGRIGRRARHQRQSPRHIGLQLVQIVLQALHRRDELHRPDARKPRLRRSRDRLIRLDRDWGRLARRAEGAREVVADRLGEVSTVDANLDEDVERLDRRLVDRDWA